MTAARLGLAIKHPPFNREKIWAAALYGAKTAQLLIMPDFLRTAFYFSVTLSSPTARATSVAYCVMASSGDVPDTTDSTIV